jgi:mono/diheme cytochrome c family protein
MTTAPDGTLYLVDMYRGIIQEGEWTKDGSYLRGQIEKLDLAKETGRGRIYRLVHDDFQPGPRPRMLDETPAQWVRHLSHPNGWWRDTAQKLLILKRDKSVVPALRALAENGTESKFRTHALWTLEGLGELTPDLALAALRDPRQEMRQTGLRLAEPFLREPAHPEILAEARARLQDAEPGVVIQAMLSLKYAGVPDAKELAKTTAEQSKSAGVYAINEQLWKEAQPEDPFLLPLLGADGLKSYRAGRTFYDSLCFACHGKDGLGAPSTPGRTIAPSLSGSPRVVGRAEAAITILLQGLDGPLDGTDYGAPMIPMAGYTDAQLADVLTYVRNSFGNRSPAVMPADIAAARNRLAPRPKPWSLAELTAHHPYLRVPFRPLANRAEWKLTASHGAATVAQAVDDDPKTGFLTNVNPYKGMWFQIELPRPATLRGLRLESEPTMPSPYHGYPDGYEILVSDDGEHWSQPVAAGPGEYVTRIHFQTPVTTRYVRIVHSDKIAWHAWSITNLELYGEELQP